MERQLKERLVGAAVLIAVAVIMVPEMFSGSGSHESENPKPPGNESSASSDSGQVKTYRIELQQREGSAVSSVNSAQAMPSVPDTHADAIASTMPQATPAETSAPDATVSNSSSRSVVSVSGTSQKSAASVEAASRSSSSAASRAATPVTPAAVGGWAVQIGSFSTEATAKKIVGEAKSQGFAAFHGPVKVGSKTLYRVRVGPYADRDAAQSALTKLKRSYAQASLVAPNH